MNDADIGWVVLARDLTDTIEVETSPTVTAVLILDAGTGLIRGVSMEETLGQSCTTAIGAALNHPPGPLPPGRPGAVLYDEAYESVLRPALSQALTGPPTVTLQAGAVPPAADDIFDSLLGHLAGREQPVDLPQPGDWSRLYRAAAHFARVAPWQAWSGGDRLHLTIDVGGTGTRHVVALPGRDGAVPGLLALPVTEGDDGVGVAVQFLPPGELPADLLAKARRYRWPEDVDLVAVPAVLTAEGPGDLDRVAAHQLTVAITAVLAHLRGSDTGSVDLEGDTVAHYTIDAAPATAAPPPAPSQLLLPTTRLRVTLREVTPPVVRVVDVPAAATLPELHALLQAAIGWTDSHLHEFATPDGRRYSALLPDADEDVRDEATGTLKQLGTRFSYLYDSGDGWEHGVEVLGPGGPQPGCPDGTGPCPPEDCGGPAGYAELPAEGLSQAWTDADRTATDGWVLATAGTVPATVRLLLDLVGDAVKLTPGGRLPRSLVRDFQQEYPDWYPLGRPASVEEDLPALAALHDVLRRVGLLRLARGVLAPTKAAADDLQIVRRLRRVFEPDGFDDVLTGVALAQLAVLGPLDEKELARLTQPWLLRWSVNGRPVSFRDVENRLGQLRFVLRALDLGDDRSGRWRAGPAAVHLLPRASTLARVLSVN